MAREDSFEVRNTLRVLPEGSGERATVNPLGIQVTVDFFTQLVLGGYAYHMQIGTEDAPVASTTSIDDVLVWMLVDNAAGYAMIPLLAETSFDFADTAVNSDLMLEVDADKARYSSGGTAFVMQPLNGNDKRAFTLGGAYVGTDITAAAKSAVPASIELARKSLTEDAVTDPTTGKLAYDPVLYSVHNRPMCVTIDASSALLHFGAGTADLTGYGVLQVAQLEKALIP